MIKRLLKKIEETSSETMVALFIYIDNKLDDLDRKSDKHDERLNDLDNKIDKFERSFDSTKAEVDSNVDRKKGIQKAIINAIVVGIIAYIFSRIGLGS